MTKQKFDVLVAGELNVDLIMNDLASFPEPGKEKLAGEMTFTLGSSSAICASNLSSLGALVAFKGKVGMDQFGKKVLQDLRNRGVATDFIIQDATNQTGITVVIHSPGKDRAMLTYPGVMRDFSADEITDNDLEQARHLHISSIFLQPGLKSGINELLQRARDLGLTTSLDPQWDPDEQWDLDLPELLRRLDLFLPNQQEFLHLTGAETIRQGAQAFSDTECAIVIKQAAKGATVIKNGKEMHQKALHNSYPVDAIGAGDSFDAGFIYKFIRNAPLDECLGFANLVGAVSTTAAGGTSAIKSFDQVVKIAKQKLGYQQT